MNHYWLLAVLLSATSVNAQAQTCGTAPLQVQILNSGGPELADGSAASAVAIWIHDKPRLLIDSGPGTALRFVQAGINLSDLDALLFTHLRVERTGDLAALLQLASPAPRKQPLSIYGPAGNKFMPSTVSFVRSLFDPTRGSWRQLGDLLSPLARSNYKLEPHDLRLPPAPLGVAREKREEVLNVFSNDVLRVTAVAVTLGQTPALIWRIESQGKRVVVGGHASGDLLERFAHGVDLLVVPHWNMDETDTSHGGTPVTLGKLARATAAKQLVLAPRSRATLGHENDTTTLIRQNYQGGLALTNDLDCLTP